MNSNTPDLRSRRSVRDRQLGGVAHSPTAPGVRRAMKIMQERVRASRRSKAPLEAFRAQTLLHVDAIYTDALCLASNSEEAAELTIAAYLRAYQEYRVSRSLPTDATLAWLYECLHASFCHKVLTAAAHSEAN